MNTFLNDPAWHGDDAQFQIYDKRSKGLGYLFGQNIHGRPVSGLGIVIFQFMIRSPWRPYYTGGLKF